MINDHPLYQSFVEREIPSECETPSV